MRIMAFVEGSSEWGATEARQGAVGVLVGRILGEHVDVAFTPTKNVGRRQGLGGTWFNKAVAAMLDAERAGFDAAIFLIDLDHPRNADRITGLSQAQNHIALTAIPRAMGVAIQEFEAWLLADEKAIHDGLKAFDETDVQVPTQPDPEATRDPKASLEAIVDKRSKSRLYVAIVECLRLEIVAKRCPDGFGTFQRRVLSLKGVQTR